MRFEQCNFNVTTVKNHILNVQRQCSTFKVIFTTVISGSILVTKMRVRRSSQLMESDPYTIIVALDNKVGCHGREFVYV